MRLTTTLALSILIFGYNAWSASITDLILGDATGFGVPLWIKLPAFVLLGALVLRFGALMIPIALVAGTVIGTHVAFAQSGGLSGSLYGFMPFGIEVPICRSDDDSALKFLDLSTTDTSSLASFQRSVICEGKSGEIFAYAYLWKETGSD